jgi:hypothetical protein
MGLLTDNRQPDFFQMSTTETAAAIINELDHFQAEFSPQGGPSGELKL